MESRPLVLISFEEALRRTGRQKTQVYDDVARGLFPRIVKDGRVSKFVESEIDDWIRARIAERDAEDLTDTAREAHRPKRHAPPPHARRAIPPASASQAQQEATA